MMAGGSNQTATTFAAVRAAVEQVHRELLKLAQKRSDSPLHGAKYEDVEARDGGMFRSGDAAAERTIHIFCDRLGRRRWKLKRRPAPRWR